MLYRDGVTVVLAFEASDGDKLRVRVIAQVETLVESTGSLRCTPGTQPED